MNKRSTSKSPVKVAAVQMAPTFKDKLSNVKRMLTLGGQAARAGARLVVFPESCNVGYSFMGEDDARPYAETVQADHIHAKVPFGQDGFTLAAMSRLAHHYYCTVVLGMMRVDEGTGNLHNSQVLVDPYGKFIHYDKVNSFGNDFLWSTPGTSNPPVFNDRELDRRVGLLICRDVRDKKDDKWKSFYDVGSADVVAFSANWGDGGFPAVSWMDFVRNNEVALVVANRYGYEVPNDFGEGGSCVIQKSGKVSCEGLLWNSDCVVLGTV